ncbi:mucin-17-like [Cynocephalus volans]|uniref:mucin-17-like n=1 Tax=Cynocephalus volans TaxID=110931 RepID=UPI002FC91874
MSWTKVYKQRLHDVAATGGAPALSLVGRGPCQNGGNWDGLKCQCPTQFYGKNCENVYPSIDIGQPPKTVSALVNLTVTVTSEVYTIALQNRSSEEFQKFNETFTKQMNIAYSGIPEYDGVNITSLTEGSVVVEHTVFLSTNYTPEFKEVLDKAAQKVKENITYVTRVQIGDIYTCKDIMCFNTSATEVLNVVTDYDPEEECKKLAGPYADYFFVEYKDGNPYCISSCASDFTTSMDCNAGECIVELSGPRCYCPTSDTHWYSGQTCQWSIRKTLVYGLLGAAGGVLLVLLAILLVFACRSRRQLERQKSKVSRFYQWHEEGSGPTPRTFQNVGFDIGEEHRGSVYPDSIYSNFQPSLSHIDHEKKDIGSDEFGPQDGKREICSQEGFPSLTFARGTRCHAELHLPLLALQCCSCHTLGGLFMGITSGHPLHPPALSRALSYCYHTFQPQPTISFLIMPLPCSKH